MLADETRMERYTEGIQKHISEDDIVLDLGTGTGILACIAAPIADTVYAIDQDPVIEIAEATAKENGLTNITFQQLHSTDFNPPEQIDVILHEIIGSELFDEKMLSSILDLKHRNVLADDGMILPGQFEFFLEPVVLNDEDKVPFIWEQDQLPVDYSFLKNTEMEARNRTFSSARMDRTTNQQISHYITEQSPLLSFDMNNMSHHTELEDQFSTTRTVVQDGVIDGLLIYFNIKFDDDICLTTNPLKRNQRLSWSQMIITTPQQQYTAGDTIDYTIRIRDIADPGTWHITV